jgi:predicted AlkP superfamily pyrophosphatase or phosphodiesterase
MILGCFGYVVKVAIQELDETSLNSKLYYNGTAWFDSTVIYISLDGFRNDYLDRKVTPNIDLLGKTWKIMQNKSYNRTNLD